MNHDKQHVDQEYLGTQHRPAPNPENIRKTGHHQMPDIDGPSFWWKAIQFLKGKTLAGRIFRRVLVTALGLAGLGEVSNIAGITQTGGQVEFITDLLTLSNVFQALGLALSVILIYLSPEIRAFGKQVGELLKKLAQFTDLGSEAGTKLSEHERTQLEAEIRALVDSIWNQYGKRWIGRLLGVRSSRQRKQ